MSNDDKVPAPPPERPNVDRVGKPLTGSGGKPGTKKLR